MSQSPASSDYELWLKNYLQQLSEDVDVDVLSAYIVGVLDCEDLAKEEKNDEIQSILSEYLGTSARDEVTTSIVQRFFECNNVESKVQDPQPDTILTLEQRMRALVQADYEHQVQMSKQTTTVESRDRDLCTTAVLRACGAAGYQGDSEDEKQAEIAITNAEFKAQQRLEAAVGKCDFTQIGDESSSSASDVDVEELESAIGYGKRDDIKPGTVQGALSLLNPSLHGGSLTLTTTPTIPNSKRPLLTNSAGSVTVVSRAVIPGPTEDSSSNRATRAERRKKAGLSKHVARVGAQAEAKHSARNPPVQSAGARNKLDQMDAFLSSGSDEERIPSVANLPEGGHNRERVIAAEKAFRASQQAACEQKRHQDKVNRAKQLEQNALRKQKAQEKAQKVERRR